MIEPSVLDARIDGLEASMRDMRAEIRALATTVATGQKTPWSTIISMAGFMFVVLVAFSNMSMEGLRVIQTRNTADISKLTENIVTRGEHVQHWANTDAAITNEQRQIDQIRQEQGGTFSLRDAIQQINSRLDKLESRHR